MGEGSKRKIWMFLLHHVTSSSSSGLTDENDLLTTAGRWMVDAKTSSYPLHVIGGEKGVRSGREGPWANWVELLTGTLK